MLLDGGPSPECIARLHHRGVDWVLAGSARRASLLGKKEGVIMIHQAGSESGFQPMVIAHPDLGGLAIAGTKDKSEKRPFTPLGLWVAEPNRTGDAYSESRLYVTNSQKVMSTIEIFKVVDGPQGVPQLQWERALLGWNTKEGLPASIDAGEQLPEYMPDKEHLFVGRPNAVTVARDGTIYVSNTFKSLDALGRGASRRQPKVGAGAEDRLHDTIATCRPGHSGWQIVAYDLGGANGLALSQDERHLVACSYFKNRLLVFPRERGSSGNVELRAPELLPLVDFHPDNVTTAGDGRFLVAGQRSAMAVFWSAVTSGLLPSRGGWAEYVLEGSQVYPDLANHGVAGPSTALRVGSHVYLSGLPGRKIARIPSVR